MKSLFTSLYGAGQRCTDVLDFFAMAAEDMAELYWDPLRRGQKLGLLHLPAVMGQLEALETQRRRLRELVAEARLADPGAVEVNLPRAVLLEIAASIPPQHPPVSAHSFFVQMAGPAADPKWVLNRVFGGFAQMFSRFMGPLAKVEGDALAAGMRRFLESVQPPGAVFAEIAGGQDTNLNLHPAITRYELLVPGERSLRPPADCLSLHELHLQHDAKTDSLRLIAPALGVEVIPLYLGSLVSGMLPDVQRLLATFSTQTMIGIELGSAAEADEGPVAFAPRLCIDRLVLARARWTVAVNALPSRAGAATDAMHLLALARWRREHQIPRHVFAKATGGLATGPADSDGVAQLFSKPMYIDFENVFSVALFERLRAATQGRLLLTEMLPGHEEQRVRRGGRTHVSELQLELCQIREGTP
jgi:hypothetical protein